MAISLKQLQALEVGQMVNLGIYGRGIVARVALTSVVINKIDRRPNGCNFFYHYEIEFFYPNPPVYVRFRKSE